MNLPDKDYFRIYTRLSAAAVMEKARAVTVLPRVLSNKGKVYLGRIGENTFEITRRIERSAYKSSVPTVPILKYIPRFMKAVVGREGEFTTIDFEVKAKQALSGAWMLTLSIIAFPFVIAVLVTIILIPVMLILSPDAKFNFEQINFAKIGQEFGRYVGAWVGISIVLILFRVYDNYKYKKRYAEILNFEKQALAEIFEGKVV